MAVTALPQSGVLGVTVRIVLDGNAHPVVEGALKPGIAGEPSRDAERLVTAPRYKGSARRDGHVASLRKGRPSGGKSAPQIANGSFRSCVTGFECRISVCRIGRIVQMETGRTQISSSSTNGGKVTSCR
jgi:hypothetical protein